MNMFKRELLNSLHSMGMSISFVWNSSTQIPQKKHGSNGLRCID